MRLRIDLRQLECFVAVAEEKGFRAAADRLHMSQPPLSRHIKQLENELGTALLIRDSRGTVLTAAGKMLLIHARKILSQASAAIEVVRRLTRATPNELRVGYTSVLDPEVFLRLEQAFRRTFPGGSLEFTTAVSTELMRRLRRRSLDVALIGLPSDTGSLVVEPLHRESLVAVLPSRHPLGKLQTISLDQIAAYPLFWPQRRSNPGFFDYYEQLFEKLGFAPQRRLVEPDDYQVLLAEVARNRGIGIVPRSMTKTHRAGTTFRPLREKELWIGFGLAHRNEVQTPAMEAFSRLVHQKLAQRALGVRKSAM